MAELHVSNVPFASTENEVRSLLELWFGKGAIVSCELKREQPFSACHKGYGFVTFLEAEQASILVCLCQEEDHDFVLQRRRLRFVVSNRGPFASARSQDNSTEAEAVAISLGCIANGTFSVLWKSDLGVNVEYDVQNRRLAFLLNVLKNSGLKEYKLEFSFKQIDLISSMSKTSDDTASALLLEL